MQFDSTASEEPPLVEDEEYSDDNQFEAGENIEAETASEPEPAEEV
jgi:hypothetical protein